MSLKTVQEEIEKTLSNSLKNRFLDQNETSYDDFDKRDVEKLKRNDLHFRLFIRARQGDLDKAYEMMIIAKRLTKTAFVLIKVECLKWRKSYKINDMKEEDLDQEVLQKGLLFYHNLDKKKHPILIFRGNLYPYKKDRKKGQEVERLFAYLLEKQQKWQLGRQLLVVCDHHDASLSNMDLDFFKFMVNLFGIYYPHILALFVCSKSTSRLHVLKQCGTVDLFHVYYEQLTGFHHSELVWESPTTEKLLVCGDWFLVVDVSWRLSAVWRVIKDWLSPDVSARFKFLDRSKLTDYVDKSELLVAVNGEDTFEYSWPPLPDNTHDDSGEHDDQRACNSNEETARYDTASSREDVNNGDEEEATGSQMRDEREPLMRSEEHMGSDLGLSSKVMGGSLGTQVRNRFKDHRQTSSEHTPPSDLHLEQASLVIRPSDEITFREVDNENEVQETITLRNNLESSVIFKVKTNSPGNFRVRPSVGALEPGSSKDITLMLILKGDSGQEKHHYGKDKFLILYAEINEEITSATDIADLWKNVPKIDVSEHRLGCRVLDVNGLEKRPKTIEDVIDMSLKLKQQLAQLEIKMENVSSSCSEIKNDLQRQFLFLRIILGLIVLSCFISWLC